MLYEESRRKRREDQVAISTRKRIAPIFDLTDNALDDPAVDRIDNSVARSIFLYIIFLLFDICRTLNYVLRTSIEGDVDTAYIFSNKS